MKTAFPEVKKETKKEAPKGKARTYTVPEADRPAPKPKVEVRPVKETHRGNTHYIEIGVGTPVVSSVYGQGVITDIADGKLVVSLRGRTDRSGGRLVAEEEISSRSVRQKRGCEEMRIHFFTAPFCALRKGGFIAEYNRKGGHWQQAAFS